MDIENRVEKIKKIFNLYSDWRPWVVFYTSTHQSMTLELYKPNLEHRTKILCGDCFYYSGYLGGVPLKLEKNYLLLLLETESEMVSEKIFNAEKSEFYIA